MPELPEVETVRRQLAPRLEGTVCEQVWADRSEKYASAVFAAGATLERLSRRGKYLIGELDSGDDLVLHLGMTGQLLLDRAPADHVRAQFVFTSATLWFRDPRRFGRALVVAHGDFSSIPTLSRLGPEPLDEEFTAERLWDFLGRPGAPVKGRLLAQEAVAGIGNYLADETLFAAGVHPAARSISRPAAKRLHAAIVDVVTRSLAAGGVSTRDYVHADGGLGSFGEQLQVYGRVGRPCVRCSTLLRRIEVAGRSSTFCPKCQRR